MTDTRSMDELKEAADGVPAPEAIAALYREAYERFGIAALWSRRAHPAPTIGMALVVAEGLRREGGMRARSLALAIEAACRAVV